MNQSYITNEDIQRKQAYLQNLLARLSTHIQENGLLSLGIYENIKSIVSENEIPEDFDDFWIEALASPEQFTDPQWPPAEPHLNHLKQMFKQIIAGIDWYRLSGFFKGKDYSVFNGFKIENQAHRSRGLVHIIDALSSLSIQPGLVVSLFNYTSITKAGAYSVWINTNGQWRPYIVDDHVPIFSNTEGQTRFFFTSPHPVRKEIWYMILEKSLAKAYKGYHNLFNGLQSSILRDLTGAPTLTYPIIGIAKGQVLNDSDYEHLDNLWVRIAKNLKKGYLLDLIPRNPTDEEKEANLKKNTYLSEFHLSNGIYCHHNYSIVALREIRSETKTERLVKLRNPWINELWNGDWSNSSTLWTEGSRKAMGYPANNQMYETIWMKLQDVMYYFEVMNSLKVSPRYFYRSIRLAMPNKRFHRAVVRIKIVAKGKYTFSLDQSDTHYFPSSQFILSPTSLTLGQLYDGEIKILSFTSNQKNRNTFIRKLIEPGDYFILIEKEVPDINRRLEIKAPHMFTGMRDCVLSVYGPHSSGLSIIEIDGNDMIYDYMLHACWRSYSRQRPGKKLTQFNVPLENGVVVPIEILYLDIPNSAIYALKNISHLSISLTTTFVGIEGAEIVGPNGNVNYQQEFILPAHGFDSFCLRLTESGTGLVPNFQIKSVQGSLINLDLLDNSENENIYKILLEKQPCIEESLIEREPSLHISNLYDPSLTVVAKLDKEIKHVRKSFVIRKREGINKLRSSYNITSKEKDVTVEQEIFNQQEFEEIIPKKKREEAIESEVLVVREVASHQLDPNNEVKSPIKPILKNRSSYEEPLQKKTDEDEVACKVKKMMEMKRDDLVFLDNKDLTDLIKALGMDEFIEHFACSQPFLELIYEKLSNQLSQKRCISRLEQIQRVSVEKLKSRTLTPQEHSQEKIQEIREVLPPKQSIVDKYLDDHYSEQRQKYRKVEKIVNTALKSVGDRVQVHLQGSPKPNKIEELQYTEITPQNSDKKDYPQQRQSKIVIEGSYIRADETDRMNTPVLTHSRYIGIDQSGRHYPHNY